MLGYMIYWFTGTIYIYTYIGTSYIITANDISYYIGIIIVLSGVTHHSHPTPVQL